jgi:hypothetical protein
MQLFPKVPSLQKKRRERPNRFHHTPLKKRGKTRAKFSITLGRIIHEGANAYGIRAAKILLIIANQQATRTQTYI